MNLKPLLFIICIMAIRHMKKGHSKSGSIQSQSGSKPAITGPKCDPHKPRTNPFAPICTKDGRLIPLGPGPVMLPGQNRSNSKGGNKGKQCDPKKPRKNPFSFCTKDGKLISFGHGPVVPKKFPGHKVRAPLKKPQQKPPNSGSPKTNKKGNECDPSKYRRTSPFSPLCINGHLLSLGHGPVVIPKNKGRPNQG